jgi:hypothetical protein
MIIDQMTKEQRMAVLARATGTDKIEARFWALCHGRYVPNGNGFATYEHKKPMKCRECGKAIRRADRESSGRFCTVCGNAFRQRLEPLGMLAQVTPVSLERGCRN